MRPSADRPDLGGPGPSWRCGARAAVFRRERVSPAGESYRKHTMGTVAEKMAKKILSSRGSRVVDLAAWRKGRKMALEAGFGDEGRLPGKFAGLDPCHAVYALAENVSSLMAESLSGMREAKGFVKIAGGAEDEYMPAGPPMSPLTVSYFTMWALFDVREQPGDHGQLHLAHRARVRHPVLADRHRRADAAFEDGLLSPLRQRGRRGRRRSAARYRHQGDRFLRGSGWLCRQRGGDMVRAPASATAPAVPPSYRVHHIETHRWSQSRQHPLPHEPEEKPLIIGPYGPARLAPPRGFPDETPPRLLPALPGSRAVRTGSRDHDRPIQFHLLQAPPRCQTTR